MCQKGKKKKIWRKKGSERNKSPRTKQFLGRSGRWLFLLLILMQNWFRVVAASGRQPKEEAELPDIAVVSDAVEGTSVNLDGKSRQEEQKGKYRRESGSGQKELIGIKRVRKSRIWGAHCYMVRLGVQKGST